MVSTLMTFNDLEPPNIAFLVIFFAIFGCRRVNRDEMDGGTTCEQELLLALARLMSISSDFLLTKPKDAVSVDCG